MLKRLLIVGLGSIGRRHARLAKKMCPDARVVALRHRDCSGELPPGVDECVSTIEAALDCGPQAAVVANPATHHLEVALPLARAGVHLLVEKPISASVEGVRELIGVCRAQGLTLVTGYNLRYLTSLQRFRDELRSGRVGRVLSVRCEVGQYLPSWRPGTDYRESVSARSELGGGVLLELSHEIDYLRWILGEVESVSAVLHRSGGLEIEVEDTAHLVIGFRSGMDEPAVVAALNMDFVRRDTQRTCAAIGAGGTLRWDGIAGTVEAFDPGGGTAWETLYSEETSRDSAYESEWSNFLGCIETGESPGVSGEDGLAVLNVIAAARESSSSGRVVSCPPTHPDGS